MRIKKITAYPLQYPEPNDLDSMRTIVLAKIEADDGLVGWGECVTMWPEASKAVKIIIEEGLAPLLMGRDPSDTYALWQQMRDHCWWYGVGGIASFAISALDIALWDLKGKALGVPLYKLLGGKVHDKLRACASTHPAKADLDELAAELSEHVDNGFTAVKIGFGKKGDANLGKDPQRDIACIRTLSEAFGDRADLMVDIGKNNHWDSAQAIRMTRAFARYNLRWIEDPLPPTNLEGYRRLRSAVDTPVGFGERSWTVEQYRHLIAANVADIFLVDPGRVEGITATKMVIDMLTLADLQFNAHTWSSAINTAACLHLTATIPNYIVFELKPRPNPMQHELVKRPIEQKNGWIDIPEGPGLGIEIDEAVVEKYLF